MFDHFTKIQQYTREKYPTWEKFKNNYSPALILNLYRDIFTVEQSISRVRITLEDLGAIYSTEKLNRPVEYVNEWLIFLNECANINKPLVQTMPVAFIFYNSHKNLYLSDLKLLFEWILRGDYGAFYNSVDAQRILMAAKSYSDVRNAQMAIIEKRIQPKLNAYMAPIIKATQDKITNKLKEQHTDEKNIEQEFKKQYREELPHLQALQDEKRTELINSLTIS